MENDLNNTRSFVPISADTLISHYRIVRKIGAGGMGEVYEADDTRLGRKVAIKFLPHYLSQDKDSRLRFKREARAAASLDHPNIVTVHEVGEFQERPYFVMQHVEGRSLAGLIKEGPIEIEKAIDIALQICEGLVKAHKLGIIHRDIKPSNVVVGGEGRVKILDFGLASLQGSETVTRTGTTMGTVGYMSPEQVKGESIDPRSDLFSVGVVFYEMITGKRPYTGESQAAVMHSILNDPVTPIRLERSDAPGEFQEIIDRALARELADRYRSAENMAKDLRKLKSKLPARRADKNRIPSIAVLPFKDMSPDRDQEYFCEGIAEEIINALTKVEEINVVARTSAFSFRDLNVDVRDVGRKLNIETVLEGSVRKSGNKVRVTAQLVKVEDGFHLWSDKYDRDMSDIFAIQDEISLAIVDQLKPRLLGEEKKKIFKRYTESVEAYHLYLKGRHHWNKRTEEQFERAIEKFRQAIDVDPAFAPAYVGLADTYILQGVYCHRKAHDVMPLAKEAVTRALDLDDNLAEAHASLAHINMLYDWDWESAEREFKRSIAINPRYAPARLWYTLTLSSQGWLEKAMTQIEKARELDPLSLIINTDVGLVHYLSGRYEKAIEEFRATLEIDPRFFVTHLALGSALIQIGRYDEALEEMQVAMKLSGDSNLAYASLGHALAVSGHKEKARSVIRDLQSRAKQQYISSYSVAPIYCGLGNADEAFKCLENAVEERTVFLIHSPLMTDPKFELLKEDPRFPELLSRMGLLSEDR